MSGTTEYFKGMMVSTYSAHFFMTRSFDSSALVDNNTLHDS